MHALYIFAESDLPTLSLSTLAYPIITDYLRYCLLHRQLSPDLDVICCVSPAARVCNLVPRLHSIIPRRRGGLTIYQQEGGRGWPGAGVQ